MQAALVDIGCNLTNRAFQKDLEDVLVRAGNAGVSRIIATGISIPGSRAAAELAQQRPGTVFATAGVHPHNARSCTSSTIGELREIADLPGVVAIGECGLDYNRNHSPPDVQRTWFEKQVVLAAGLKKPLFLHDRDASEDMQRILKYHRPGISRGVLHCFTGDRAALKGYLDLDMYIGITGWICDERRGKHLLDLISFIPEDRLMVETDAPFLFPRTIQSGVKEKRNEPSHLPYVVKMIAMATGKSIEEISKITTRNAEAFFSLEPMSAPV